MPYERLDRVLFGKEAHLENTVLIGFELLRSAQACSERSLRGFATVAMRVIRGSKCTDNPDKCCCWPHSCSSSASKCLKPTGWVRVECFSFGLQSSADFNFCWGTSCPSKSSGQEDLRILWEIRVRQAAGHVVAPALAVRNGCLPMLLFLFDSLCTE